MKHIALLLLASCAAPVAYRADVAFSAPERAEIAQAAADWNERLKPDKRITEGDAWKVLKQEPPHSFNGECHRGVKTIWIRPAPVDASVYAVALHEWGHALGLGHTTTGVMMATTVSTEFTPEVMTECRKAGVCR